jgi:MHS family proline/betaine transporter-like MFS transporter
VPGGAGLLDRRRGFLGSWLDFGTFVGYSLGSGLVTVLTAVVGDDGMVEWGWRIPFLVAGPLGVIGLYMRLRLEESPAFQQEAERTAEAAKAAAAGGGSAPVEAPPAVSDPGCLTRGPSHG